MLDALGERGFGLLLMLFAIPNLLPFPGVPGVSFVTGMAILFISVQLILAKDEPAFPDWVSHKSFSRAQLSRVIFFSIQAGDPTMTKTRSRPDNCLTRNVQSSYVSDGNGRPPKGAESHSKGVGEMRTCWGASGGPFSSSRVMRPRNVLPSVTLSTSPSTSAGSA